MKYVYGLLVCGTVFFTNSAWAITIEGNQYDLFATVNTSSDSGQFAYWRSMQKFMTFVRGSSGNTPIPVNVIELADDFAGSTVAKINAMGTSTSASFDSTVASGFVTLIDAAGATLLQANFLRGGVIDSTTVGGVAGQLNISGLYSVAGGTLSGSPSFLNPIYVEFLFDKVTDLSSGDIWTNTGSIKFYRTSDGPGETEVPEPASALLLGTSLMLLRKRRKAA